MCMHTRWCRKEVGLFVESVKKFNLLIYLQSDLTYRHTSVVDDMADKVRELYK